VCGTGAGEYYWWSGRGRRGNQCCSPKSYHDPAKEVIGVACQGLHRGKSDGKTVLLLGGGGRGGGEP